MKNKKKRGFTLVELLVVIAILAILATVSILGYTSFTAKAKYSNAQSELAQTVEILMANTLDAREHEWKHITTEAADAKVKVVTFTGEGAVTYDKNKYYTLCTNTSHDHTGEVKVGSSYYVLDTADTAVEGTHYEYTAAVTEQSDKYTIQYNGTTKNYTVKKNGTADSTLTWAIFKEFLGEDVNLNGKFTINFASSNAGVIESIVYELDSVKCQWTAATGAYAQVD